MARRRTAMGGLLVSQQGGEASQQAERQPQDAALLAGAVDASGAGVISAGEADCTMANHCYEHSHLLEGG